MQKLLLLIAITLIVIPLSACSSANKQSTALAPVSDKVIITFDYKNQSGYASNQFAVWIENTDGNLVKTLYATRFTAKGGYKKRPDTLPTWVEKSDVTSLNKSEIDAITGATPKAGTLSYIWDLTDKNGDAVSLGEYNFFVEGNLRWKNRVLHSGNIMLEDHMPKIVQAEEFFFYNASDEQPALTADSPENTMIGPVTANFVPAGEN